MPGLQVADVLAGCHATIAMLAALQARERTGRGQHADIAMSDASMPLLLVTMGRHDDLESLGPPDGAWHPKGGVWECADGGFLCTTDMEPRYWARFCEAVGRPDFIPLQHEADRHKEMRETLEAIFRTRTRGEWFDLLAAADTQAMPVLSIAEALDHPHNRARGMSVDVGVEEGGEPVRQLGLPFRLSETGPVEPKAAGLPGAESEEILRGLGFGAEEIRALEREGAFADRRKEGG
jgi:crotonobetainyl-CoA:carnitine CoA-transferase CaiB-like acyl-CoA transferase